MAESRNDEGTPRLIKNQRKDNYLKESEDEKTGAISEKMRKLRESLPIIDMKQTIHT